MFRFWVLLAVIVAVIAPARAMESAAVASAHATVTLVTETDAVQPGKSLRLGLRFKLTPGWHIYWSNPGDAGEPPQLDLTLPQGASASPLAFPTPVRIAEGPVMTFSYLGDVLLPLTVSVPADAGSAFPIDAKASWLVCAKICVPEDGSFHLDLRSGPAAPSHEAPLFAAADARLPRPSPFTAHIAPDGTLSVAGEGLSRATVADAWFFPSGNTALDNAASQKLTVGNGALRLALKPGLSFDRAGGMSGVLVLKDLGGQESALDIAATPGAAPAIAEAAPETGLVETLVFAFLGGLILNLMPCVFPVLAMKAVGIARLSGAAQGEVRAHAAWYTGGVLIAFAGLGGLLLGLRAAGSIAGWGFQFQSPVFVAATAWLLFAVGLNLSGVYAVGAGIIGAGQSLTSRPGHFGSFFAGLLAVLVATPCTAPFMGAAIAAALAASPVVTIGIFLTMGLGLAAPYALLVLVPGLARLLPRPGRWMDVLKQALAFPMYGAAAWLVWVVSQQAGPDGVLAAMVGLVLLGFAGWAVGAAQASDGVGRRVGQGVALAAIAASLFVLSQIAGSPPATAGTQAASAAGEEPFTPARLATLRAEGKPVFVNMTASWCVTCLVNERVALSSATVHEAFAAQHVAYLKGDWTRQDPAISQYLREHDRDGVPLYVYYPAGKGDPTVLPQILTESAVLDLVNGSAG